MKLLRRVLLGGAILAVLVAFVLVLAFTSGVQTWAVRRVLADQPGLKAEVEKVDVGLKRIEIGRVRIARAGMVLTAPSATIDVSLLSAAGKDVQVRRLVAKGWMLELTNSAGSTDSQPPAGPEAQALQAFDGVFKMLRLPVDFSLDEVELEGEVLFPGRPGEPAGRAKLRLTGGQLGAGREGRLTVVATVGIAPASAPVSQLEAQGLLSVRMDTPRTFERVAGAIEVKATGRQFPQGTSLLADFDLTGSPRGENYTFILQGAGRTKKLLDLSATLPVGATALSGHWRLDASHADLAPFTLGWTLPVFTVSGEGALEVSRTRATAHATGRLDARVEHLEALSPELQVLGQVGAQIDFDLSKDGELVRAERLSAAVSGAKPIASLQALQRIEFNLRTRELKVATPASELVRVTLHGLPLAWAQPFLKDLVVTGDDVRGEFFASARNSSGFAVRPSAPVTLNNLSVSQGGRPLLRAVDIAVKMTADYTPHGWQGEVSDLSVRSGGALLLALSLKAGQPAGPKQPIKAAGRYEANLPALLAQPAATGLTALTQGVARGEFSASVDSVRQALARVEFVGLAVGQKELPGVSLDLRVDVQADGTIDAVVPIVVDASGRKSDLELSAHLKTSGTSTSIDAELRSTSLFITDLQLFQSAIVPQPLTPVPTPAAAGGGAKPAAGGQPVAVPVVDKVPFWSAYTGRVKLALKEVIYSPEVKVANVTGSLRIEGGAITLEGVRAGLGTDSEAALSGKLSFDPAVSEPYSFTGDASVTNFDPVPFFRALDPSKAPTVEGRFNVTSKLSGSAPNSALLVRRVKADVGLTSKSGVFRGLALPSAFAERFQGKSGGLISNIGGVVGALAGSNSGEIAQAAVALVSLLAEPRYDQLSLQVTRDGATGSTKLNDFTLISPKFRLTGTGSVLQQDGVPFLKQPLTALLEMSVHGDTAQLLGRNNLLRGDADALGYSPLFSPVRLDGSLAQVGTQSLATLLLQKLASSSTGPFGNLFGK